MPESLDLNPWKTWAIRAAQLIFVVEAGLLSVVLAPVFLIIGLHVPQAISNPEATIGKLGGVFMACVAYLSMIVLVFAHGLTLKTGKRREALWSSTLLHAIFCWAAMAFLVGDWAWFIDGDLASGHLLVAIIISAHLFLSVTVLFIMA